VLWKMENSGRLMCDAVCVFLQAVANVWKALKSFKSLVGARQMTRHIPA
jgi:hypothetical protein